MDQNTVFQMRKKRRSAAFHFKKSDRTHLTGTANNVFETGQLLDANRAAGVQFSRGNADFRPHAEFAAVGKLGRGVVQDRRAVDMRQECGCRRP